VAAGLRTKTLSATPHIYDGSVALAQLSRETAALIKGPDGKAAIVDRILGRVMPPTLMGEGLQRMNALALSVLGDRLSRLADDKETALPNLWLWLRELMMAASGLAVYGKDDPFAGDPKMEQAMWYVSPARRVPLFAPRLAPSHLMPRSHLRPVC